jgi:RNA polymerase sigma-70 factor (ECF subfamily)
MQYMDPDVDSTDDVELLARTAMGDREAFAEFFRRNVSLLYSTAFRVLNNSSDAEDVTQDVMFMLWEKSPMYDKSRGKPSTWAVTMARNKAIDKLRSIQRRTKLNSGIELESRIHEQTAETTLPADGLESLEQNTLVRSAVLKLNKEQREVIELAYFGGLSQQEISHRINKPIGTVKARIRRGMIRLRKLVATQV